MFPCRLLILERRILAANLDGVDGWGSGSLQQVPCASCIGCLWGGAHNNLVGRCTHRKKHTMSIPFPVSSHLLRMMKLTKYIKAIDIHSILFFEGWVEVIRIKNQVLHPKTLTSDTVGRSLMPGMACAMAAWMAARSAGVNAAELGPTSAMVIVTPGLGVSLGIGSPHAGCAVAGACACTGF